MILAFLLRRWWLIRNRLFSTVGFLILFPIMLHVGITMVMKNIMVRSINQIPYEAWVFPGILMVISAVVVFPHLYRDLFDLRVHKKSLIPMTLAPVSKTMLITSFLVAACSESLVFVLTGMLILSFLTPHPFPLIGYFLIPVFALGFSALLGNLMITLSLITDRITTYLSAILIVFIVILFGSGILVEFEFYPYSIGMILSHFPTSMILSSLRALIFYHRLDWPGIVVPTLITLCWIWLNGRLLQRKLNQ
jgi:ABC-type polysaccharide/polyol phosphate export permease